MPTNSASAGDIRIVHSSDLHVDDDRIAALHEGDGSGVLRAVLATARALGANLVILAGDTFDNHQVRTETIDRAAQVGCGAVPAYYSGSPDYVGTVNLVRLTAAGEVIVTREPVLRDNG